MRHYFLRADDPAKAAEVQTLVRRLQRMDVKVYRLTAPLTVPDFKPYGRPAGRTVLPAGTYWIPMAQMQKHWIQSLLNENTYVPFPYFYDVSGWSNPLLFNVSGGRSGAVLSPAAELVAPLARSRRAAAAGSDLPASAVYQISSGTSARESTGWLRYLLEQVWHLPYQQVTSAQIAAGRSGERRRAARPERGVDDRVERARASGQEGAPRLGQRRRRVRRLARRRGSRRAARPDHGARSQSRTPTSPAR